MKRNRKPCRAAETFVANVQRVIDRKGLSQREVARRSGVSAVTICHLLNGTRGVPHLRICEAVAIGLGVPLSRMFRNVP